MDDGLIFIDEDSGEKWVFNYRTFYELVVACVKRYGNKTDIEAKNIVDNSFLIIDPPTNVMALRLLAHECEYHWAMLLLYGDEYWKKIPDSYPPSDEHYQWLEQYQQEHNLADDTIEGPE